VHVNEKFLPANHYRLQVRSAGIIHTVQWTDATKTSTAEADRLRDLFTTMITLITDLPDVKKLPSFKGGCE
jgi:hypothetical protein